MSDYEAVDLPPCWGLDTNTKLSAASARALASATFRGQPVRFVWRYVFFGDPLRGDIDADEARAICDAGLILLLVQHPRNPGWLASAERGKSDGEWAARNAWEAGYPADCCIALDLEGLGNSGQPVIEHAEAWAKEVIAAGYKPVVYVGYDCGLTPQQLYELPSFARYWSDFGQRSVMKRGFCCKQHPQQSLCGIEVDMDQAYPDDLGGVLTGMAEAKADTRPELEDPPDAA